MRLIGEPTTPLDPFLPGHNSPDDAVNRTTADGHMIEEAQKPSISQGDNSQRAHMQSQSKRKEIPGEETKKHIKTTSELPGSVHTDKLLFEMQKLKLDEQFRKDVPAKSRSRSVSQTSSQSNSSTGSVKSVIKKSDGQTRQSSGGGGGHDGSKIKEKKRSHRKEKQEAQQVSRQPLDVSLRSPVSSRGFEDFNHPSVRLTSLRRSSVGDSSSTSSLEKMTQFIAQAINEDPEEIRKKLAAVEKKRAKAKNKKKQTPSLEMTTAPTESKTSDFSPLASSSPQAHSSPERMTYSHGSQGSHNITDSPNVLSSYTMENSVFQSEDSISMVPLSLKELDSQDISSNQKSMSLPESGSFVHIIPQFGDTYTVRRATKEAEQQQHVPVIDPRKHRTHEIEQRLNRSLPQSKDASDSQNGNFSHPEVTGQFQSLTQGMTTLQSQFSSPRQRFETSDSAVGSMTTALTDDITNNRHSWPEATPSRQHNRRDFSQLDHLKQHTSQPTNSAAEGPTTCSAPLANLRAIAPPANNGEGPLSSTHGHQAGSFVKQDFSQVVTPLSIAPGITPFGQPSTLPHLYPSNNINGFIGVPSMMGPPHAGNGANVQTNGGLPHMAPTAYDPRMLSLGSALFPAQGLGSMNTFHGRVPFVQTVSASMGPKPSSLTPTYVQSLNADIPHNIVNPQIPLHLQTNSNMSGLPTSFTQPRVTASMPYQHTPPQQVPTGLLQVIPDYSQGATVPPPTQVIIPGEINLPQFCCVGVLTETVIPLHNSSSRWMHCEIRSVLSTANGVQVRVVG